MYLCPECRLSAPTLYPYHGQLYCALCLPDDGDGTDDLLTRYQLSQIKTAALKEELHRRIGPLVALLTVRPAAEAPLKERR